MCKLNMHKWKSGSIPIGQYGLTLYLECVLCDKKCFSFKSNTWLKVEQRKFDFLEKQVQTRSVIIEKRKRLCTSRL